VTQGSTGTGQAFTALIHRALRGYQSADELARLAALADLPGWQTQRRSLPAAEVALAFRALLDAGLARLADEAPAAADVLRRRFIQGQPVAEIARALNYSERSVYLRQDAALTRLAQLIWDIDAAAQAGAPLTAAQQTALAALPPPTYSRLFGVAGLLARLNALVADPQSCWLIALEGIGGVGKTALARAAAEALVREGRLQRVLWVTARQQFFAWGHTQTETRPALTYDNLCEELRAALGLPAADGQPAGEQERQLRAALATQPTLVVVDNLETAADVQAVVAGLDRLARPTKVLLTTRHRVGAYECATSLSLHELGHEDALAFIHYHAAERNAAALLDAPLDDLARIADVTFGNPLAIKLVVGQLRARPLAAVLDDLTHARAGARDFFLYIFRYSWAQLSPAGRQLLLHMPLLDARGARAEELATVAGVTTDDGFWQAIEELVDCSLLHAGRAAGQTIYSIHRLTEYFLLSDLARIDWADPR
jgi:hypothetical protein